MDQMNITAEATCLLGDTGSDMETARSAGILPIGALWGFRTAEELESGGASILIGKPGELLVHLEG